MEQPREPRNSPQTYRVNWLFTKLQKQFSGVSTAVWTDGAETIGYPQTKWKDKTNTKLLLPIPHSLNKY